jgi:2-dehydro-3-deoxyphosphogluconate aldolase/(4S)-4-hydroxy-2-oxoglutarate aldolase
MNAAEVGDILFRARITPVMAVSDADAAAGTIDALAEAGIGVIEIVLRSAVATEAIAATRRRHPHLVVAAGTVLDEEAYTAAVAAGAHFAVSPGLEPGLAAYARGAAIPLVPGVQTASEVMAARAKGFSLLKYYPAVPSNGSQVLADFANVFPGIAFMPTGKITAAVLGEYAALRNVLCCGGSWMFSEGGRTLAPAEIAARVSASLEIMSKHRS